MDIPDDYGMFSDKGNQEIKEAVENTLFHIYNLEKQDITLDRLNEIAWDRLYRVRSRHDEATDTMVREAYFITLDKFLFKDGIIEDGIFTRLSNKELEEWTE